MLFIKKYILWILPACCIGLQVCAQDNSPQPPADSAVKKEEKLITITAISVSGNKKTKSSIILRELPFRTGEKYTLSELLQKFEQARKQLMNTSLFHSAVVAAGETRGQEMEILVLVKERWYLFPIPYFKPIDRNLNQWIVEQHASLDRVNYGIKVLHGNATGRNDKLRLYLISGYTRQLSLTYDRLYIDRQMKWGMKLGFATGKNRELNYNTIQDKQVFLKQENYVRNFTQSYFELTYRPAIKTRHSFGIAWATEKVADTIVALNPAYFKSGRNSISFPDLYYNMTYYNLDYIPYPRKGYGADVLVGRRGFNQGVDLWYLSVKGLGSWPLNDKMFFNLNVYGGLKLPFRQPYFNKQFLGYRDIFMQGFEYYVIDGVAGGYLKATLARELVNFKIRVPGTGRKKETEYIPFRIFGKVYGNTGYVHNPQPGDNTLSNTLLYSGGLGIDILTFYDVTFKLEWSFNQLGQNGLFLHRKNIF